MQKWFWALALAAVLALNLAAGEKGKTETWTGWISDNGCGVQGVNAAHKDCAIRCVKEKGAKYVFVNTQSKQVFAIHNQDAVKEVHVGKEVRLTGMLMEDKSLHVESIKPVE